MPVFFSFFVVISKRGPLGEERVGWLSWSQLHSSKGDLFVAMIMMVASSCAMSNR